MHSRRHTTRLPYYRHKTFPTQIFRKLLIVTQRQFFGCVPPFTRTSDTVLGFYHYHADFIWDRHLCSPMRGYVRTSAHGGHHELYSPAHNAMCKRGDTPTISASIAGCGLLTGSRLRDIRSACHGALRALVIGMGQHCLKSLLIPCC